MPNQTFRVQMVYLSQEYFNKQITYNKLTTNLMTQ